MCCLFLYGCNVKDNSNCISFFARNPSLSSLKFLSEKITKTRRQATSPGTDGRLLITKWMLTCLQVVDERWGLQVSEESKNTKNSKKNRGSKKVET